MLSYRQFFRDFIYFFFKKKISSTCVLYTKLKKKNQMKPLFQRNSIFHWFMVRQLFYPNSEKKKKSPLSSHIRAYFCKTFMYMSIIKCFKKWDFIYLTVSVRWLVFFWILRWLSWRRFWFNYRKWGCDLWSYL